MLVSGLIKSEKLPARIALTGFAVSAFAVAALLLAGIGNRFHWWNFKTAIGLARLTPLLGGAGALLCLCAGLLIVFRTSPTRRGSLPALLGLCLGVTLLTLSFSWKRSLETLPRIHDISTDTEDPPQFEALLAKREHALNSVAYEGAVIAEQQKAAYPDLKTFESELEASSLFEKAHQTARDMGWKVISADAGTGRIEASDTTFWFGFVDDVVIRIQAREGGGSRLDIRSLSRVGLSDLGTNARRIRNFISKLGKNL